MRALGVTCGIGSMLYGARKSGFKIVGNIEWRPYYHTGTFEHNFKDAFMVKKVTDLNPDQIKDLQDVDLIMGHTECGSYSTLSNTVVAKEGAEFMNMMRNSMGDIPEFIDTVSLFQPKYFAMDNLVT
jgi:site-specific DNA-cytosine methylase